MRVQYISNGEARLEVDARNSRGRISIVADTDTGCRVLYARRKCLFFTAIISESITGASHRYILHGSTIKAVY